MVLKPFLLLMLTVVHCQSQIQRDWLVDSVDDTVRLIENRMSVIGPGGTLTNVTTISLTNGLINRTFLLQPDFGTVDFVSLNEGGRILRALTQEAVVGLDDLQYFVGGLQMGANETYAYLDRFPISVNVNASAWHYKSYATTTPQAPFPWMPGTRHSPSDVSWPLKGLQLVVSFQAPSTAPSPHQAVQINVHYEMYVGIPLLSKWISINYTGSASDVVVSKVWPEYLATNPPYSPRDYGWQAHPWSRGPGVTGSWLYVETDQAHGTSINWVDDSHIGASPGSGEPVVYCSYTIGPQVQLGNGKMGYKEFTSFRVLELVTDSVDPERVGLSRHRMTRLLAPQTQENPIFLHGTKSDPTGFREAIDQMVEVGFEMFFYSFGSGFNLESADQTYLSQIRSDIAYAKSKGIEVGGYDLICLERGHGGYGGNVGDQWDIIDPNTKKPGQNACFSSGWLDKLSQLVFNFVNYTGLSGIETDGPYGGSECSSTTHDHHTGLLDSVYEQTKAQGEFYRKLREANVYIHQPDNFFYQGGSKTGMGYNENQYSLPRWQDLSVSRQTMYDNTYHFIPTQGWMFLPLVQYHGGGSAATFEPLSQNIVEYEWGLAQYFGYGVAPCYRGYRLYDSNETMSVVKKWVTFFKTYRDILVSDIVHIRRPDMQGIDAIIHVNPKLNHRGLAMVFNPTAVAISETLKIPLYYTGIKKSAHVSKEGGNSIVYQLEHNFSVHIEISLSPMNLTWFVFESGDESGVTV